MAKQYKEIVLESEFKPEYIRKIMQIQKEPIIRIGSTVELRKRYGFEVNVRRRIRSTSTGPLGS